MDRPVLPDAHTTTWSSADMEVVALTDHHLGIDVQAVLYTGGGPGVPIVFLVTSMRDSKRLKSLVGKTVPVKMIGDLDRRGNFTPEMLQMHREKPFDGAWFSPRARPA